MGFFRKRTSILQMLKVDNTEGSIFSEIYFESKTYKKFKPHYNFFFSTLFAASLLTGECLENSAI